MSELLTRHRFTIEEYHRMGETGILPEDNRLELIAGDIVVREPIGAQHASTVDRLARLWMSRLPRGVSRPHDRRRRSHRLSALALLTSRA